MLGSPLAETVPVYNNFRLATGRLRTSRSVIAAGCSSQMAQQKNIRSKLFRKSRPHQPAGPSTVCLVAEAWQRMHRNEVWQRGRSGSHVQHATTEELVVTDADVVTPKFFPFVPQTDVRQAFLEYRYTAAARGGSLFIRPISESHMHDTTELLTQSFSEAMGYMSVYRTFLRRHIRQYLQQHAHLPPKTVVLVALLSPSKQATVRPAAQESSSGAAQRLSRSAEAAGAASAAEMAAERERASVHTNIEDLLQRLNAARMPGSDTAGSPMGGPATDGEEPGQTAEAASRSGTDEEGTLVGTVEVSVAASTRTRFLTLNAPEECAYVCNMAVNPEYRRRGYGLLLLEAAEEIARLGGQRDLYLHLRFQDKPAQVLYQRAGYTVYKQDNPFVVLLGQDRRYLMHKRLTPGLTPGSA